MTVSVIIPCFNNEAFVAEAIKSVLDQDIQDLELIVVDDGSTDNSSAVIGSFQQVKLIRQANKGVSTARNNGAKAASGSFLLFLDADDRLHPGAIEAHLKAFAENQSRVLIFGVCDVITSTGAILYSHRQSPSVYTYWDILLGITPNPSQCMIRRQAFDQIGGFKADLVYGEDWDCFLRLSRMGECYCHDAVVADYRKHGGQSTRRPSKILISMLGIIREHSLSYENTTEDSERFRKARDHYTRFFGKWIPSETLKHLRAGRYRAAVQSTAIFLRFLPDSAYGLPKVVRSLLDRKASGPGLTLGAYD